MGKAVPKSEVRNGKVIHFSVGAVIVNKVGEILLVDRKWPPPGFAGVAGHVDEGDSPEEAIIREVLEESGLTATKTELLYEEFIEWNYCNSGVTGHHWYLYKVTTTGEPAPQLDEVKSIGWYSKERLSELKLEEVWQYWFRKLGYIS